MVTPIWPAFPELQHQAAAVADTIARMNQLVGLGTCDFGENRRTEHLHGVKHALTVDEKELPRRRRSGMSRHQRFERVCRYTGEPATRKAYIIDPTVDKKRRPIYQDEKNRI